MTLGYAGTVLPELKEARRWRAQADAVIAEHLRRDFQADGGYQERTPDYTAYVLGLFATYARLLETHPAADPATTASARGIVDAIHSVTEGCLAVWAGLATPLGMPPTVNDTRRGTEMSRLLVAGAREFGRPDFLGPAGLAAGETPPAPVGTAAFPRACPFSSPSPASPSCAATGHRAPATSS